MIVPIIPTAPHIEYAILRGISLSAKDKDTKAHKTIKIADIPSILCLKP